MKTYQSVVHVSVGGEYGAGGGVSARSRKCGDPHPHTHIPYSLFYGKHCGSAVRIYRCVIFMPRFLLAVILGQLFETTAIISCFTDVILRTSLSFSA
jgi:hypothetical protein